MFEVPIPQGLYQQAVNEAQAHHVSLEAFVAEAIELRLQDEASDFDYVFTPERLAELDKAAASAESHPGYSRAEVDELLAQNKQAWLKKNQS